MAQDFAQGIISALQAGQQFRTNKRLEAQAVEDRDVEKELLQHRLRELKLTEKMRARAAAKENLGLMSGMPQNEVPESALTPLTDQQLQGDTGPGMIATQPETIQPAQRRMNPVHIPGIEEYGVPGVDVRPQTLEEVLAELAARKTAERAGTTHSLGADGTLVDGNGNVIARGQPRSFAPRAPQRVEVTLPDGSKELRFLPPEEVAGQTFKSAPPLDNSVVPITNRDATGTETTNFVPRKDAVGKTSVKAPLPQRPRASGQDLRGDAAKTASDAVEELVRQMDDPAQTGPSGGFFGFGQTPASPGLAGALANARLNLSVFISQGGAPTAASNAAAMAYLPDGLSKEELKVKLPSIRNLLGYRAGLKKPDAAGGGAAPASRFIMRDGVLYVDGKPVGEP